jgi:predicted protein tyrosine phosphatase
MPMNVLNVSRLVAQEATYSPEVVVVSITDPRQAPATLAWPEAEVLRVAFHDVDLSPADAARRGITLMTQAHADAIASFVRANPDKHVLVHCEAGISRSYSVASAIADAGYELRGTGIRNAHVYGLMRAALALE